MRRAIWLLLVFPACAATWTDRSEYDLALTVRSEALPKKRLELLEQWKTRYPKSDYRQMRRELTLSAYQSLGDSRGMLVAAREMLSDDPGNLTGLYWAAVLVPAGKDNSPDTLSLGERSAKKLLASPRPETDLLAHRAMGWIHWQRGEHVAAAEEFSTYLKREPNSAEISSWLGMVLALQKEQQPAALWHLARAASLTGDGVLSETQLRQVNNLLERLYTSYHGDADGLEQLRASAVKSVFPAADFNIESAAVIAARKQEEELRRTNPELAAWLDLRKQLDSADGEKYFAEKLRDTPLPKLKGAVIRFAPAHRPQEIVLALRDSVSEEVLLKLTSPFPNGPEPDTVLEFEGTATAFSATPFILTVTANREKVEGWPNPRPHH